MPKPPPSLHIRLERLALAELPAGGEARLRAQIARELERQLAEDARSGRLSPLPPNPTQAARIADQIRRALPPGIGSRATYPRGDRA